MLTSERLLKTISILTVLITLGFSASVVIAELMRPEKMFDKIVEDSCGGKYSVEEKATMESDLESAENLCILVKKPSTTFLKLVSKLGKLENHHYLYKGSEGILIKKSSTDYSAFADHIQKCIRSSDCSLGELKDSRISVTGLIYDRNGELVCSSTFSDTSLSQVNKGFRRLFTEICKFKKKELPQLALKLLFHQNYTLIEQKEPEHVNSLLNNDTDGLYISSRGAKIRVLPFEYSKDGMKILNRKGRQYGLKKDEYKNDLAKIYLFRTSQYFENKMKMVPWEGNTALSKKDYSDNIAAMFLEKHLENALAAKRRFVLEQSIGDGRNGKKYASFFTQLSLAEAIYDVSPISKNILSKLENMELSDLTASYLFNIKSLMENNSDATSEFVTKTSEKFSDPETVKKLIVKNPVYTGFFLESHLLATDDAKSVEKLFDTAIGEFDKLKKKNQIRLIIYLGELLPEKDSTLFNKVSKFVNARHELFRSVIFDNRGFDKTAGSISLKKSSEPDTALSLAAASGLSELSKRGFLDRDLLEVESGLGNFIKFMIVTGDDFPRWKDPKTKVKVQGGVRSHVGSEKIKLSNTIRAYSYFKNRTKPADTQ